ncbi:MAG: TIM barrel protein [Gaiellales bacterium]
MSSVCAPGGGAPATSPTVGVDSYAYHRLLGEIRPGETTTAQRFARGSLDVVAEARRLALDFVFLQTSFLGDPEAFSPYAALAEAGDLALGLSWGAPAGFEFGDRGDALPDLLAWLPHAATLGLPVTRIVAGGPAQRGRSEKPLPGLLREACAAARDHGLRLALENHGDLTAAQLERLLEQVDGLRICFDTANALRVRDDVAAAARRLAEAIEIIHLKDCEGAWDDELAGPASVPLGEGVIPIEAVLDACPSALVCIELGQLGPSTHERALVGAYVDYLRSR